MSAAWNWEAPRPEGGFFRGSAATLLGAKRAVSKVAPEGDGWQVAAIFAPEGPCATVARYSARKGRWCWSRTLDHTGFVEVDAPLQAPARIRHACICTHE